MIYSTSSMQMILVSMILMQMTSQVLETIEDVVDVADAVVDVAADVAVEVLAVEAEAEVEVEAEEEAEEEVEAEAEVIAVAVVVGVDRIAVVVAAAVEVDQETGIAQETLSWLETILIILLELLSRVQHLFSVYVIILVLADNIRIKSNNDRKSSDSKVGGFFIVHSSDMQWFLNILKYKKESM